MSNKVMSICDWIEKKAEHFGDYSRVVEDFKELCDMEKATAIQDGKPFDLKSHDHSVSNGCIRLNNLRATAGRKKK